MTEDQRVFPGKITNSDIILKVNNPLIDQGNKTSWQNLQLKPNLKEQEHFMIVDDNVFRFWENKYTCSKE